jgi:hypothetical protein
MAVTAELSEHDACECDGSSKNAGRAIWLININTLVKLVHTFLFTMVSEQ